MVLAIVLTVQATFKMFDDDDDDDGGEYGVNWEKIEK